MARAAMSATLDDEPPLVTLRALEQHLAACDDCRAWQAAAYGVTRRVRLDAARNPGPSTAELIAAVREQADLPRPARGTGLARTGLLTIALAQIAITVPLLVLGRDHHAPAHVAHELGSFDLALAVGFVVAAWRPVHANGMRWIVGAISALLVLTAFIDVASGRADWIDELPHLLAVAGWLLLCRLAVAGPPLPQHARGLGRGEATRHAHAHRRTHHTAA